MLNKEKYAEEIVEIACSGKHIAIISGMPAVCVGTMCGECDFLGKPCNEKIKEWANSEYVEPSVDWSKVPVDTPILVRDIESDEWERRYFAKYEDNTVYVCPAELLGHNELDKSMILQLTTKVNTL